MKTDGCELNNINDECYDAHHGQQDCHLLGLNNNHDLVSYIDYSIYDNDIYINMVKTIKKCRRRGLATKLMKKIEKLYPNRKINIGYSSGDGSLFLIAYKRGKMKPHTVHTKIEEMRKTNPERYADYMKARKRIMPWPEYRRKWK